MAAGMPGTGIGGLFFILSAFAMLIVEIGQTLRGRSSRARWGIVLRNLAIATTMVIAVSAAFWAVQTVFFADDPKSQQRSWLTPLIPLLITLGILLLVLSAASALRLIVAARPTATEALPATRASHAGDPLRT